MDFQILRNIKRIFECIHTEYVKQSPGIGRGETVFVLLFPSWL